MDRIKAFLSGGRGTEPIIKDEPHHFVRVNEVRYGLLLISNELCVRPRLSGVGRRRRISSAVVSRRADECSKRSSIVLHLDLCSLLTVAAVSGRVIARTAVFLRGGWPTPTAELRAKRASCRAG